jgi:hypothetical protein
VVVQDWLIVGMGDSNGSGQGTVTAFLTDPYEFPQCDRGRHSYQAQVAQLIEELDKKTSVTFVHTSCSGARSAHVVNKKYVGQEANPNNMLPPQIRQVTDRLRGGKPKREVDAVILSIGVNDIRFRGIIETCLKNFTLTPCAAVPVEKVTLDFGELSLLPSSGRKAAPLDDVVRELIAALPKRYKSVASGLKRLKVRPNRVLITPYPDPTTNVDGSICGTSPPAPTMGPVEWSWIGVAGLLLTRQVEATAALGFTPVPGIPDVFFRHGYCAGEQTFFQNTAGSVLAQGNIFGTFHSLLPGHELMAAQVLPLACTQMYGDDRCEGTPRAPGTKEPDPTGRER